MLRHEVSIVHFSVSKVASPRLRGFTYQFSFRFTGGSIMRSTARSVGKSIFSARLCRHLHTSRLSLPLSLQTTTFSVGTDVSLRGLHIVRFKSKEPAAASHQKESASSKNTTRSSVNLNEKKVPSMPAFWLNFLSLRRASYKNGIIFYSYSYRSISQADIG